MERRRRLTDSKDAEMLRGKGREEEKMKSGRHSELVRESEWGTEIQGHAANYQ